MRSIKHTLASKSDSRTTILNSEVVKLIGSNNNFDQITLYYVDHNFSIKYHPSRGGKTWYADSKFPQHVALPKIGQPIYYNVEFIKETKSIINDLTLDLQAIRDWAQNRGLYEKGDSKTQTIKLYEEVGELSKAILKKDQSEIIDSLGDIVVVLTNLAHMNGLKLEDCIKLAYSVIKNRKGTMINGTFVKDGSTL